MDKDTILKSELKDFNINIDDVKSNDDIFVALEETILKMRNEYLINRLEVVLNNNLIEVKDKITTCRTIFGCRISYDNLPKNISFIVREDIKPTYEQLEQQVKKQKEVIDKVEELLIIKKTRCLNEDDYVLNVPDLDDILHLVKEVSE